MGLMSAPEALEYGTSATPLLPVVPRLPLKVISQPNLQTRRQARGSTGTVMVPARWSAEGPFHSENHLAPPDKRMVIFTAKVGRMA